MGTRSTTKIYSDGELLLALYKQYDGYTDSWGKELKEFIRSGVFVNGISVYKQENKNMFNGIGDFALQLVTNFKEGVGGLYATTEGDSQEYNYRIDWTNPTKEGEKSILKITCLEEASFNETIKLEAN